MRADVFLAAAGIVPPVFGLLPRARLDHRPSYNPCGKVLKIENICTWEPKLKKQIDCMCRKNNIRDVWKECAEYMVVNKLEDTPDIFKGMESAYDVLCDEEIPSPVPFNTLKAIAKDMKGRALTEVYRVAQAYKENPRYCMSCHKSNTHEQSCQSESLGRHNQSSDYCSCMRKPSKQSLFRDCKKCIDNSDILIAAAYSNILSTFLDHFCEKHPESDSSSGPDLGGNSHVTSVTLDTPMPSEVPMRRHKRSYFPEYESSVDPFQRYSKTPSTDDSWTHFPRPTAELYKRRISEASSHIVDPYDPYGKDYDDGKADFEDFYESKPIKGDKGTNDWLPAKHLVNSENDMEADGDYHAIPTPHIMKVMTYTTTIAVTQTPTIVEAVTVTVPITAYAGISLSVAGAPALSSASSSSSNADEEARSRKPLAVAKPDEIVYKKVPEPVPETVEQDVHQEIVEQGGNSEAVGAFNEKTHKKAQEVLPGETRSREQKAGQELDENPYKKTQEAPPVAESALPKMERLENQYDTGSRHLWGEFAD